MLRCERGSAVEVGVGSVGSVGDDEAWSRHPLSAALLAHPAAAPEVIAGACAALERAAAAPMAAARVDELRATWLRLRPFFAFVLLRPAGGVGGGGGGAGDAGADHATVVALRASLASALVRLACAHTSVAELVAPLLLRCAACLPLGGIGGG